MKYMLLIYHDEQSWEGITEAERQQIYGEYQKLRGELVSRGQCVSGSELQPVTTATTVRVRDGKELITDGPFAETHEQLGGYFLIEASKISTKPRASPREFPPQKPAPSRFVHSPRAPLRLRHRTAQRLQNAFVLCAFSCNARLYVAGEQDTRTGLSRRVRANHFHAHPYLRIV